MDQAHQQGQDILEQANQLQIDRKYDEAEKIYDQILAQNPDNPAVLVNMGTLYAKMGKIGLGISFLKRVADGDSVLAKQSDVLCNLAISYKYAGLYAECQKWFEKAIKRDPSAETLANYSALFVNVGLPDKCEQEAKKAIARDKQNALAHWNLSLAQLELGKWATAWDEHEWGFDALMRHDRKVGGRPRWDGTPGKTIVVYGEQGIGDEIMFSSMLPDLLKTNKVIFECHPRLLTLFQRSFPEIKCYGTRDQKEVGWHDAEEYDYQISIGSLGKFFRRSTDAFPGTPYLKAEGQKGAKFRVGISWTGGMKEGRVRVRSIPLPWWKSILSNDCDFISLQYTEAEAELKLMDDLGYSIKRNESVFAQDYYETAKLVQSCDLVISCCTSVIHLAGALGVPCWVMTPNKPAWRYGIKGPMVWYRSVRLYRQPPGDRDAWLPVVEKVGFDLSERLQQKAA